jgi:hypothetical protein
LCRGKLTILPIPGFIGGVSTSKDTKEKFTPGGDELLTCSCIIVRQRRGSSSHAISQDKTQGNVATDFNIIGAVSKL